MVNRDIDFLMIYEIPTRDLENCLLVGTELIKRGYSVEYLQFPFKNVIQKRRELYNRVKVILVGSMYNNNVLFWMVYNIVGSVEKIVNLQCEQIRTKSWEEDYSSYQYPQEQGRNTKHLCWGKKQYNMLLKAGIQEKNLFLCGALQLDFLRDEFSEYYFERATVFKQYNIDESKRVVLFVSSFSYATLLPHEKEDLTRVIGKKKVDGFVQVSIDSRKIVLEWIEKILDKDIIFIYRPHPEEKISEDLRRIMEAHSNFKVISDYSIKQWIKYVDKIYTWNSTAVGEIYAANKNFQVIRPIPLSDEDNAVLFDQNAEYINTYQQLEEDIFTNNCFPTDFVREYYDIIDEPSYKRFANCLEDYISDKEDCFIWSAELVKKFRKRRFKRNIIECLLVVYHGLDKVLLTLNNIKICKPILCKLKLNKRIEKVIARKSKDEIRETDIANIMDKLEVIRGIVNAN